MHDDMALLYPEDTDINMQVALMVHSIWISTYKTLVVYVLDSYEPDMSQLLPADPNIEYACLWSNNLHVNCTMHA